MNEPAAGTWPPRTTWAAYAACALALLSAIPSFYWAAGGTIGLATVGGAIEELARARDPAGVALGVGAGVLKVAGGVLALALVRPWGRGVPRRLLGGVAWAASVVLTLYGGLLVAVGALVLAGVVRPVELTRFPGQPESGRQSRPREVRDGTHLPSRVPP
jgi:hypothetical protein